jgi:nucleotide-binding universal stress UspA family protein
MNAQMNAPALDTKSLLRVKNILYATDLSFASERALPFAHEIARRYGAMVHVVHAIQPDVSPFVPPTEWPRMAEDEEVFRQESMADLEESLKDVPHELIFTPGDVAEVLSEAIQKTKSDLLVMSTHGRTGVRKALVGSMAEKMFRRATCPVLTVGPGVIAKQRSSGGLNRILYATDFSVESLAAAPFAISLACEHRAHLILLHCMDHDSDTFEGMRRTLADLVPYGVELREEPVCIVARVKPVEKILTVAEEHGVDLIVLGIRGAKDGQSEAAQMLHPGVFRIVTEAKCPVLTVRG